MLLLVHCTGPFVDLCLHHCCMTCYIRVTGCIVHIYIIRKNSDLMSRNTESMPSIYR